MPLTINITEMVGFIGVKIGTTLLRDLISNVHPRKAVNPMNATMSPAPLENNWERIKSF